MPVDTVNKEVVANILFFDDQYAVFTNQQSITISTNINMPNSTRRANAHLIDPYALQYVFTYNQIANFDTYPYPYYFTDYHDLLYRNSLYLFYFYICGMDTVENDRVFLPQMDLNNQFLRIESCETKYNQFRQSYLVPSIVAGCVTLFVVSAGILICCWRSKLCATRRAGVNVMLKKCCMCCFQPINEIGKQRQQQTKKKSLAKTSNPNIVFGNFVFIMDSIQAYIHKQKNYSIKFC